MPVTNQIKLNPSWFKILKRQFEMPYFLKLSDFIKREYLSKKIYPHPKNIFRAMDICPFNEVKVVIVGQDPYHNDEQADGLCFSVPNDVKIPPSLCNIFKEIENDLGIKTLKSGDLSRWAEQGVLLLNSTLTVVKNSPASHKGLGWEVFTDQIIKSVSDKKENIVFILWGNFAKSKKNLIDKDKHLILESAHPSPFSVSGFLGCKHFSKTNNFLQKKGLSAINWQ